MNELKEEGILGSRAREAPPVDVANETLATHKAKMPPQPAGASRISKAPKGSRQERGVVPTTPSTNGGGSSQSARKLPRVTNSLLDP